MLEVGAIVAGKYRIERIVGMGGMGVVAVATHVQLDQKFALKVVHDAMAEDASIVERFMREARASAKLKSEHVCRVSDVDQLDGGAPFIVMELLDGHDLQKVVQAAILPIATAADYVLQACIAIAEAHGVGIVHRDLKPANLFLTNRMDGTPLIKVLDFGIAKATADAELQITQTQTIMGSPGYMSPEQLRSARDVDARSDIWSLGVILYELTTGTLPFIGQTITELAVKVTVDPPKPLPATMDPRFAAIIGRCLEKDVARRYQAVTELANDLSPFAGASGSHSAQLIARLSGSQPGVSAPRSAIVPQPSPQTQLTGFGTTAPPAHAPTVVSPPPVRSKRPLLIIGAVLLLAGAATAGYVLTRKTEEKIVEKHEPPRDAGKNFETVTLERLRAAKKWAEIIDMGKTADPNDKELATAIADARTAYGSEALVRIDAAVKAGACEQANAIVTGASRYAEPAPLVAAAATCVPRKPVGSGSGSGLGSGSTKPIPVPVPVVPDERLTPNKVKELVAAGDRALDAKQYAEALALAKRVLVDTRHPHVLAARIAAIASCQLGRPKDAQDYANKIPTAGPRNAAVRMLVIRVCETKRIEID